MLMQHIIVLYFKEHTQSKNNLLCGTLSYYKLDSVKFQSTGYNCTIDLNFKYTAYITLSTFVFLSDHLLLFRKYYYAYMKNGDTVASKSYLFHA